MGQLQPDSNTQSNTMQSLASWVTFNGGFVDPTICILDRDQTDPAKRSRGVFAGPQGLPANHVFLRLPHNRIISADNCRISQFFDEWNCRYELSSWDSLILALIYEHTHRPSPWDAYLDFLPDQLETPTFWTSDERALLKDTAAEFSLGLDAIEAAFWDRILPVMNDHPDLFPCNSSERHRLYYRFGSIVMAYSFTLGSHASDQSENDTDDDDQSPNVAMVPIADALNHISFATNAVLMNDDVEGCVSMQTLRAIAPGEELINTYGELGNDVLLVRYGFVDKRENPFTNAVIRYSDLISTVGQQAFQRMTVLGHKDYDLVDEYFFLRRPTEDEDLLDQIPDCLKTLLICAIITDEELSRIAESVDEVDLSPYSERMMKLLLKAFERLPQLNVDDSQFMRCSEGSRLHNIYRLKLEAVSIMTAWRNALAQRVL